MDAETSCACRVVIVDGDRSWLALYERDEVSKLRGAQVREKQGVRRAVRKGKEE